MYLELHAANQIPWSLTTFAEDLTYAKEAGPQRPPTDDDDTDFTYAAAAGPQRPPTDNDDTDFTYAAAAGPQRPPTDDDDTDFTYAAAAGPQRPPTDDDDTDFTYAAAAGPQRPPTDDDDTDFTYAAAAGPQRPPTDDDDTDFTYAAAAGPQRPPTDDDDTDFTESATAGPQRIPAHAATSAAPEHGHRSQHHHARKHLPTAMDFADPEAEDPRPAPKESVESFWEDGPLSSAPAQASRRPVSHAASVTPTAARTSTGLLAGKTVATVTTVAAVSLADSAKLGAGSAARDDGKLLQDSGHQAGPMTARTVAGGVRAGGGTQGTDVSKANEELEDDDSDHLDDDSDHLDDEVPPAAPIPVQPVRQKLPSGWRSRVDAASGKTYYWNEITGVPNAPGGIMANASPGCSCSPVHPR